MKPIVRGKTIYLREVNLNDAEFIVSLRTNPSKGQFLSKVDSDVEKQKKYISNYQNSLDDFYFIISDWQNNSLGTVRIYDIRGNSFCWGSWIISSNATRTTAIESALLIYDFCFFSLHYDESHFDVRKKNARVVDFHLRFGAEIKSEDDLNFYFKYDRQTYLKTRDKYSKFLP